MKLNSTTKAAAENKQLEAEQHIAQWSVGHRRNKRGNQKIPGS
jgi:hypothetical protein